MTKKTGAGYGQWLLAGTIAGSLLLVPAVQAGTDGAATPPPPGPYTAGAADGQHRFRPDTEL
ncbi:MAG TPA: hypothetical protein ENK49_03625, partial [Gammaproteobacteria bacterium]|nr:hypothetical protein [Gammaproteobacteria bacterium]